MQDGYAGDIGDFIKLGLLRALLPGRRLSVAWFKTMPAQGANTGPRDGRFIEYLADRGRGELRALDPELFDGLKQMVDRSERSVAALEPLLAGPPILLRDHSWPPPPPLATFHSDVLTQDVCRSVWYVGLSRFADRADLLFLDPDNGITPSPRPSPKHVALAELHDLQLSAKTLIVYHHLGRRDSHAEQIDHLGKRLVEPYSARAVCAIWTRRWSSRVFFIVAPDRQLWNRAKAFAEAWSPHVTFYALSDSSDGLGLTPDADAWQRAEAREPIVRRQIERGDFATAFSKRRSASSEPQADG